MAINLRQTVNKEKLKAKFEASSQAGNQGPSDFLPYFKLKNKDSLTLRFLSDANSDNQDTFTYPEDVFNFSGKNMKFEGLAKECPASKIANDYFAEAKSAGEDTPEGKELRDKALKFYKKRKFLANAYIVNAPDYFWQSAGLDKDVVADRVKIVSLPKKVHENITDTVMDEDFDDVEFYNFADDVVNFKLTVKVNTGGYNDYSSSKFEIKPKELEVSDADIDIIADGLKDLSTIFKVYTLADFNEAIAIELDDDDDSKSAPPQVTKTEKPVKKVESTTAEKGTDDGDDDGDDESEGATSISNMRSNILNKLINKSGT